MSKCEYCGNNQVSHAEEWVDTTVTALTNDFISRFGMLTRLRDLVNSTWGLKLVVAIFSFIGAVKYSDDVSKAVGDRARVLWEEAKRRGIRMRMLIFFGKPSDVFEATVVGKKILFSGLPRSFKNTPWNAYLDDKAMVKEKLHEAGIPVPRGGRAATFSKARRIFMSLQKPVVVKPRIGSRGRHTTTHITTEEELKSAFKCAKQICFQVIVEEHLIGSVYRSTLIDFVSEGILRGDPPRVTGDGIHRVAELVALKNNSRDPRVNPVQISPAHREHLARIGIQETDVLERGRTIDLIERIGIRSGGLSADDTDNIHPETTEVLEKAARLLGDPIIGLDFITPDISASPKENRWGIVECNAIPFINLHNDPIKGKTRNVAGAVWNYVERHIDEF